MAEWKFPESIRVAMHAVMTLMNKEDSGICNKGEMFEKIRATSCEDPGYRKVGFYSSDGKTERTMAFVHVECLEKGRSHVWILHSVGYTHVKTREPIYLNRTDVYGDEVDQK